MTANVDITTKPIFILGGGGHASVVADLMDQLGKAVAGFVTPSVSDELSARGNIVAVAEDDFYAGTDPSDVKLVNGIGFLPGSDIRKKAFEKAHARGFGFQTIIHPSAILSTAASIATGAQVFAGAIIQPNAVIGEQVIVNTGAQIDHASRVGEHTHIAPGAVICGNVDIGADCFIGAGAVLVNNITVKQASVVKAGALVARSL